jgi:putative membrane protein
MLINKRIPLWFICEKVKFELFAITVFSLVVGVFDVKFNMSELAIPIAVPAILGNTIALLLAFRTNQAYDRWIEARVVWGSIVNRSRVLIREMQNFTDGQAAQSLIETMVKRQIAWLYCLGDKLRGVENLDLLSRYLDKETLDKATSTSNIPNFLLGKHYEDIQHAYKNKWLNEVQQIKVEQTLTDLVDAMGMCERIKSTVFPRTYNILLHFLIYVFAIFLPFSLMNFPVLAEVLITVSITTLFFLIENTAIYTQDPFEGRATDTPVTAIARKIEIDLLEMIGAQNIPKQMEPNGFYLM